MHAYIYMHMYTYMYMDAYIHAWSNVSTKFRCNNQNIWRKVQNVISYPETRRHFPSSRSFDVKFADKLPLNPSNVPTKFSWKNQNTLGEKCKKYYFDLDLDSVQCHINNWHSCTTHLQRVTLISYTLPFESAPLTFLMHLRLLGIVPVYHFQFYSNTLLFLV